MLSMPRSANFELLPVADGNFINLHVVLTETGSDSAGSGCVSSNGNVYTI